MRVSLMTLAVTGLVILVVGVVLVVVTRGRQDDDETVTDQE